MDVTEAAHFANFEARWAKLQQKPRNFQGWCDLVSTAEQTDISHLRRAYEAFLPRYPLCYGYWKKWAEAEAASGDSEAALAVYERALAAFPGSVHLWAAYVSYLIGIASPPEHIRSVFQRGAAVLDADYLGQQFWDKYLDFESGPQGSPPSLSALWVQILGVPMQSITKYYERFRAWAANLTSEQIACEGELEQLKSTLIEESTEALNKAIQAHREALTTAEVSSAVGLVTATSQAKADAESTLRRATLPEVVHSRLLMNRNRIYTKAFADVQERSVFEVSIKRPYFHVKELDSGQLDTWRRYIDWQEQHDDEKASLALLNRCLVSCAMYPEFWLRWFWWMYSHDKSEQALGELKLAVDRYGLNTAPFQVEYATILESVGEIDEARQVFREAYSKSPEHPPLIVRYSQFLRRRSELTEALNVLTNGTKIANSEEIQLVLARFHISQGSYEDARQVLDHLLTVNPTFVEGWDTWCTFETHVSADNAVAVLDRAVNANLTQKDLLRFMALRIQLIDEKMDSVPRLIASQNELRKKELSFRAITTNKRPLMDDSMSMPAQRRPPPPPMAMPQQMMMMQGWPQQQWNPMQQWGGQQWR